MDNDDVIRAEDFSELRAKVSVLRRKVLVTTAAVSVLAGALAGLMFFYLKSSNLVTAAFIGSLFFAMGLYYFIGWYRHYRAIFKQIDHLERRVCGGEVLYGSEIKFHSYDSAV